MVFNFLRKFFKKRQSYTINEDDVYHPPSDSVLFEKEVTSAPKLMKATPISPLLWRYIFPSALPNPTDFQDDQEAAVSSRNGHTRGSTTSSAGYGTGSSSVGGRSSYPGLGCGSSGGFSSTETSPVAEVRQPSYRGDAAFTPTNLVELSIPATLPPNTPYRLSLARLQYRKKAPADIEVAIPEESSFIWGATDNTPTNYLDEVIPATLSPKTPYRASFARREVRTKKSRSSDMLEKVGFAPTEESSIEPNIWGTPKYSPSSTDDLDSPQSACTPERSAFARHETRKISLRRQPSATVSGLVKQMVQFFENDSERVQIPRRLDHVPAEFMRSCPQTYCTPDASETAHGYTTHSDLVRGVSTSSNHCTRCDSHYRTPNSRRASMA